jgi:hypothetical protein
MSKVNESKATEVTLDSLMNNIDNVLPAGKNMIFRQGSISGPSLLALVTASWQLYDNVHETRNAWLQAIAARNAAQEAARQLVKDCQDGAYATFGEGSYQYEELGFTPKKKPAPLTPEQKQTKLDRLRATRAARHTLGSRQKKAVKGVVNPEPPAPSGSTGTPSK